MLLKTKKENAEGPRYNSNLKRQGNDNIEHALFDPSKNFPLEKYFQVHLKSHEIHAEVLDPVPE